MLSFCIEGESGLSREGSDQQEDAGSHPSHIWGCTAADLHSHAQRLLPTIPQLLCLQITGAGGVTLLVWVIDPRPTPLSLILSIWFLPISLHLTHCTTTRGESTPFLCRHDWIIIFVLLSPCSSLIFEGIPHFFWTCTDWNWKTQGWKCSFHLSNPLFFPSFQHQLLIFTAIFFFFHTNMLRYLYLLTSLVEESWKGLCNNIHWSGLTNLLLSPHPDLCTVSVLGLALWGDESRGDWWHCKREGQHFFQVLNK